MFIGSTKVFDSINHLILLRKCEKYGIVNKALSWLTSYLSDCTQQVKVLGHISNPSVLKLGILQGSFLGPILFTIYINDFKAVGDLHRSIVLYVEDTTALVRNSNIGVAIQTTITAFSRLSTWFAVNKLKPNKSKTKFMAFSPNIQCLKITFQIPSPIISLQSLGSTLFVYWEWT